MPITTAREVENLFGNTPAGGAALRRWQVNQRYQESGVVDAVSAHYVEKAYNLGFKHVAKICATTEHPLNNLRPPQGKPLQNWNTPFTMAYVMHHGIEAFGVLPTWQEFRRYNTTPEGKRLLADSVAAVVRGDPALKDAATWRIGLQYYSFLREIYIVSWLRDKAALDIRVHPLADAVFRVDAWCSNVALAIYVPNSRYRDGALGRKKATADIIKGSHFKVCELVVEVPKTFGRVAVPTESTLAASAEIIRQAMSD